MDQILLDLPYKGDRDYLHGTDIYNAIVSHTGLDPAETSHTHLRLIFRRLCNQQCSMTYTDDHTALSSIENAVAEFDLACGDRRIAGWFNETSQPVHKRIMYHEDRIVRECTVHDNTIELRGNAPFSPIEVLVAMNKYLHKVLTDTKASRWLFTRLELTRLLRVEDIPRFQIVMTQNFRNLMTKSSIGVEGIMIGNIYFSRV